ncbi:MAG: hypothetical protein MK033_12455 [Candidatus Caenarcaniphilales bacterium]|nr:hypothetical protein [Candidatus Caenarcaniphilales bacterium]
MANISYQVNNKFLDTYLIDPNINSEIIIMPIIMPKVHIYDHLDPRANHEEISKHGEENEAKPSSAVIIKGKIENNILDLSQNCIFFNNDFSHVPYHLAEDLIRGLVFQLRDSSELNKMIEGFKFHSDDIRLLKESAQEVLSEEDLFFLVSRVENDEFKTRRIEEGK